MSGKDIPCLQSCLPSLPSPTKMPPSHLLSALPKPQRWLISASTNVLSLGPTLAWLGHVCALAYLSLY